MSEIGGIELQVCVVSPIAVGRIKRNGFVPRIVVDRFGTQALNKAILYRVNSIRGNSWEQIVDHKWAYMLHRART
jgi:hypothetical protein